MKKIINNPSHIVEEMIEGMLLTHGDILERVEGSNVLKRKHLKKGKVALVSGGGSGHEPAHAGFVGEGMLDAAVCGEVFTSPTPDQILEAIKAVDTGAGVLLIIKNYSGDVMNFEMAQELAEMEGIEVESVIIDDDIAVSKDDTAGRRGVAGTIMMHKILGAMAEEGASLKEMKTYAESIRPRIKTLGLALSGATVPEVGKPGFVLEDDEIEYGVGIHGEPGYRKEKLQPSSILAKELISQLRQEMNWQTGDEYGVFVNGLGNTPKMELYVFMRDVLLLLDQEGLNVSYHLVEEYMTAIDMAGVSLTLMHMDDKMKNYLKAASYTAAWKERL